MKHRSDFRIKEGGVGEATDLDACLRKSGSKSKKREGQGQEQALLEWERYKQEGKKQQTEM